ncbi:hypothetical protein KC217_24625, partial [Mycobacterium tuberculosis]|nr:hypothetical protein [Mycobacterium tuberculosis]
ASRLKELERCQIVGLRRDSEFEGLAELARAVTGLPMAMLGFIAEDGVSIRAVSGAMAGEPADVPASATGLMASAIAG